MKRWALGAIFVSALALAACSSKSSTTTGGGGSGGGTGGGDTTSAGNTTGSTTGTGATTGSTTGSTTGAGQTTSTGGQSCDNTGVCQDPNGGADCATCALNGACSQQLADCQNDADCTAFVQCLQGCQQGDMTCEQDCVNQHQAGAQTYSALVSCVVCDQCPNDCDAAGSGCM